MEIAFLYKTKIGEITLSENGQAITGLHFGATNLVIEETTLLKNAAKQLDEYLAGSRRIFEIPLFFNGTTHQNLVWNALKNIPYGKTYSYKQIAETIGHPKSARAVGTANNKNPIPIFIPCHRVITTNGDLGGYKGGLKLKEFLLTLERKITEPGN